ncbi:transcription factor ORG2-like [Tripterygium wilfordii]|uniref:Transcription factor ORG2-like n=1 Tax=Tripterygium wilfordii TaxID=458696 RepID=A0A7J7DVE9_TRIWF|nr:transcription factor ORG2-like [Tripterygium wilfordii]
MLALSPSVFSTFGWLLEESLISHETTTDDHQSLLDDQYYLSQPPAQQPTSEPLHAFTSCGTVDHQVPNNNSKKLNHNASERHRRKKINGFYSSLRSLLPFDDQKVERSYKLESAILSDKLLSLREKGVYLFP